MRAMAAVMVAGVVTECGASEPNSPAARKEMTRTAMARPTRTMMERARPRVRFKVFFQTMAIHAGPVAPKRNHGREAVRGAVRAAFDARAARRAARRADASTAAVSNVASARRTQR